MSNYQNNLNTIIRENLIPNKTIGQVKINGSKYFILPKEWECNGSASYISSNKETLPSIEIVGEIKLKSQNYWLVEIDDAFGESSSGLNTLLTGRELQISQLIAIGYSNKEIARNLGISTWTVATHLRRIFAKLGVSSRAAMVHECSQIQHQS